MNDPQIFWLISNIIIMKKIIIIIIIIYFVLSKDPLD